MPKDSKHWQKVTVCICISILFISTAAIICSNFQFVHAVVQKNFFVAKVTIDKHVVKRGQTQTIDVVVSSQSGVPLTSGTRVTYTIDYADLKTTRQATVPVDASGHASYSWQIGDHVKPGQFDPRVAVDGPGFETLTIDLQFFVVEKGHH